MLNSEMNKMQVGTNNSDADTKQKQRNETDTKESLCVSAGLRVADPDQTEGACFPTPEDEHHLKVWISICLAKIWSRLSDRMAATSEATLTSKDQQITASFLSSSGAAGQIFTVDYGNTLRFSRSTWMRSVCQNIKIPAHQTWIQTRKIS